MTPFNAELKWVIEENLCTFFIGSGISEGVPTWSDLATEVKRRLLDGGHLTPEELEGFDYYTLFSLYEQAETPIALSNLIRQMIGNCGAQPNKLHRMLVKSPVTTFITTNFDTLLERACEDEGVPFESISQDDQIHRLNTHKKRIIHMHGSVENPHRLVITAEHYAEYTAVRPLTDQLVRTFFFLQPLIFAGFGMRDKNFQLIVGWLNNTLKENFFLKNSIHKHHVIFVDERRAWVEKWQENPRVKVHDIKSDGGSSRTAALERFLRETRGGSDGVA
jgi:hypothetical protein